MLYLQTVMYLPMGGAVQKREPFPRSKREMCESVDFIFLAWEMASQGTQGQQGQEWLAKEVLGQGGGWPLLGFFVLFFFFFFSIFPFFFFFDRQDQDQT